MVAARGARGALVGILIVSSLALAACSGPPALTQKQIDAKTTPKKHPKLTEKQRANCQGCHKVVAGSTSTSPGSSTPGAATSKPPAPSD